MSQPETVTLTREQLYDLVWSKPMTEIATEFGVSSVAFAKYCKKLGVPRPTRGYWQQLQWGQKPERDSLPPRTSATRASIVIVKHEPREVIPQASSAAPKIVVSASLRNPHPVIVQLQQELRGSWRRQDGESVAGAAIPCSVRRDRRRIAACGSSTRSSRLWTSVGTRYASATRREPNVGGGWRSS